KFTHFLQRIKTSLKAHYKMHDIGEANWILKIQIQRIPTGLWLGQSQYTQKILEHCGFWDIPESQWKATPMIASWKNDTSSPSLSKTKATKFISLLMKAAYLANRTRPDIAFVVNKLAQYQKNATEHHRKSLCHLLQYLRGTYNYG